ncbi:MAG: TonB-dependent receptor [Acidobacteriota bacterium]|nr:TonB-dependent receptor [Acidobacteriota bacterium]MDQ3417379.1 TonB-dependent receptor [Acidobacteriota bacterium]
MNRRWLSCLCPLVLSFFVSSGVLAQSKVLSGRVVQSGSGKPVPGALVSLPGLPGTAKTDANGEFTWSAPPAPPFQVIVVLPGGQVARPVDVTTLDGEVLTIAVDALANESVRVVGAAPSIAAAPAAAKSLLSSAQVVRRNPENLMQALETVPGVNQVSEGHATVPAIRGLARGRTLVLIDGARVSSERRAGPSATYADPATFEGIDVARGPGSVAYGSDALGGVISVRTRRAQAGSPLTIKGSGTFGGGIPERRASIEVAKGLALGGLFAQAHARDADDWDSPVDDSEILNSGWQDSGFNGRFDHQIANGLFSAGWQSDFGRDIERPRNNSQTVRFYYPYEDSHRLTSSYEMPSLGPLEQFAITGFVGTFNQRTDQDRFATATTGRSIERADMSADDFHVKASAAHGLGRARLEFGVDVNGRFGLEAVGTTQRYDLTGALVSETNNLSVDAARRTNTGVYVQADGSVASRLRLAGGARLDYVSTTNRGGVFGDRDTDHGAVSGFLSATVAPVERLTVTGQVARGFRDPTLSDRYFRGPSGRGFITGNPDLEPETSLQYDVAARYAIGRTQLAAYGYHYRINDLVERYSTATDFFFFRNRGRARVRGIELEARTSLGAGVGVEAGMNIGRGTARDDDAKLDDIAPDSVFFIVQKDFGASAYGQIRMSFMADDDRPGPSEIAAPGAQILDLSGGWRFTRYLELRGIVRNLLDEAYYASPDPRWVYAPGRSGSVTVGFQF